MTEISETALLRAINELLNRASPLSPLDRCKLQALEANLLFVQAQKVLKRADQFRDDCRMAVVLARLEVETAKATAAKMSRRCVFWQTSGRTAISRSEALLKSFQQRWSDGGTNFITGQSNREAHASRCAVSVSTKT